MESVAPTSSGVLHRGRRFVTTRSCAKDGTTVVIKTLRDKHDEASADALRHEHAVLRGLTTVDDIGVVRPLELVEGGVPALVMQDLGGATLRDRRLPLDTQAFLDVSIALAQLLGRVHAQGVIHRDLCPSNIMLDPVGRPRLIDFELAVTHPVSLSQMPRALGESLPYVAPEQCGRMSRSVDQRSDLYSLGVVFYELLTGAPPFRADNRLAIVHDHLARVPVSASLVAPRVPAPLSRIVDKLLSKRPEDRYQTALALASDLAEAGRQWKATGHIAPFVPGSLDLALELPLPDRLYGRSRELSELDATFERVRSGGTELVFVAGNAGVGKSALVRRFRDDVRRRGARFIEGKSDLRKANVPYASLVEAAAMLLSEPLALPELDREAWRTAILEAVGPNGRILTELVPELASLIGEQPPVPLVDSFAARLRLQEALRALFGAFVADGRPLVVFLDDVQWADAATLEVVRALADAPIGSRLMFVAAVRPDEAGSAQLHLEADLRADGVAFGRIDLSPLCVSDVEALLADTLGTPEGVAELASLVQRKTAGNPFAIRQWLRAMQRDGIVTFDRDQGRWIWNVRDAEAIAVTNDVAELLAKAIDVLPSTARAILPIAACLGKRIDVETLAAVASLAKEDVSIALEQAASEGLIVHDERHHHAKFCFAHDRVQKAAYARIDELARQEIHLRVGRLLATRASTDGAPVFDVADQMNLGAPLLVADDERLELARLDAVAAEQAQCRAAYGPALAYFEAGIAALPTRSWDVHHDLAFALHRGAVESALVVGDHGLVSERSREALAHTSVRREKADIHSLLVASATVAANWSAVFTRLELALRDLGLGEALPVDLDDAIAREREAIDASMRGRTPESLADTSNVMSEDDEALMRLLGMTQAPAWFRDSKLFDFLVARSLRFMLERGIAPSSLTTITSWALCLCARGRLDEADAYARLATTLAERFGDRGQQAHAMLQTSLLRAWRAPYRAVIPQMKQAFALAVDCGEVRTAAFALSGIDSHLWAAGIELDEMLGRFDADAAFLRRTRNGVTLRARFTYRQAIRALKGLTSARGRFDDDDFDEASFLASCRDEEATRCMYELRRLVTSYLLRDPIEASTHAKKALTTIAIFVATPSAVEFVFYWSLTLAALCERVAPDRRGDLLDEIHQNQRTMGAWLEECPANFRNKHALVAAEIARIEERHAEASDAYEASIEAADASGFLHEKALACELAGRHAFGRGRARIADLYLVAARTAYAEWGATEKVRMLEEEFPLLRSSASSAARSPAGDAGLDLEAVLRVTGSLSREIELGPLLDQLLRACVAIAGAERVILILEEPEGPFVRAAGTASETDVGEHEQLARAALPVSLIEEVRRSRRALVIDDTSRDPRGFEHFRDRAPNSVLAVPIERKSALVGVLYCENGLITHAFTPGRVSSLQLLAGHMASALANALLLEQLRAEIDERTRAERRVRFLADAGAVLAESLDDELTLAGLANLVVPALADACAIDLVGRDGPKTVSGAQLDLRNVVTVPLVAHDRTIGAMHFGSANPDRYGPIDLALFRELGRRVALAVDSARLFREAETAVRLRDEFLSVAAHELNTPLTSLKLMVQGLTLRRAQSPESLDRALALADRQIRRTTRLVEQLLDVSRLNAGRLELEPERVDLALLARETIEQFADTIRQSGSTVQLVDAGPIVGRWDRLRIEQVVTNLLSNAVKFGEGKPITVTVSVRDGRAVLKVSDHGIGMAPDQVGRVFDRFERAVSVRSYGGLGLGLYIVRRIVVAHGGEVTVESREREGSTFVVELPMQEEEAHARDP